jgi:hypothetical protein
MDTESAARLGELAGGGSDEGVSVTTIEAVRELALTLPRSYEALVGVCGVHLFGSPSGAGHLDLGLNQSSARGKRRRFADAPDGTPSKLSGRRSGLARESSIGPGRVGPVVVPLGNSPPIP